MVASNATSTNALRVFERGATVQAEEYLLIYSGTRVRLVGYSRAVPFGAASSCQPIMYDMEWRSLRHIPQSYVAAGAGHAAIAAMRVEVVKALLIHTCKVCSTLESCPS